MKNSISQLDQAYEICRKETQQWAKTFYLGTLLLPQEKRKAIWAIYVWCRRTDEIMDSVEASTKSQDELSDNLDEWEENTKNIFKGNIKYPFEKGDRKEMKRGPLEFFFLILQVKSKYRCLRTHTST